MNKQQTIVNNIKIATFMELIYSKNSDTFIVPLNINCDSQRTWRTDIKGGYHFAPEKLRFNSSWDWLIPVTEMCFEKGEHVLDDLHFKLNDALLEINKESLYEVIVSFIDYYNSLNEVGQ